MDLEAALSEVFQQDRLTCGVARFLNTVSDEDRAKLEPVMRNHDAKAAKLAKVIKQFYGVNINESTLRRHRRQECSCQNKA